MSDNVIVFAATGRRPSGPAEVTAFLVPLNRRGVTVAPAYEKLGWRASDTHPLFFDDVHVGDDAVLGSVGEGNAWSLGFLTWARIPFAALAVGVAQGCVEETLAFVRSRQSFGQPLERHQAVSFGIADMAALTASARVTTYDAAWKRDQGLPIDREAAICKLIASEIANKVAYRATQLHGGYGFIEESPVARHYRDARILTIGEGTSEVQRMVIARQLGLAV
jgi:alkylation response protein AidB-like acyl-CoA dehydrogenase